MQFKPSVWIWIVGGGSIKGHFYSFFFGEKKLWLKVIKQINNKKEVNKSTKKWLSDKESDIVQSSLSTIFLVLLF